MSILPHLPRALLPFEHPAKVPTARNYDSFMAEIEASLA